ncbi:MAG: GNAT family N-acetyltransferase [Spirochaetaceae bacterium]|nr:GNAT family N-acetyltransferase [Spirochaetaceae bacterium]
MSRLGLSIHELTPGHRDWNDYVDVIEGEGQGRWAFAAQFEPFPHHYVVARQESDIVGFIMYVVWDIGPHDRNHPPLSVDGQTLTETKIVAFGVKQAYRRQGIGRALQEHVIRRARELGCYQVRSVSDADHPANRQLKLAMGFGVEPMERDKPTLAFIMPLRPR